MAKRISRVLGGLVGCVGLAAGCQRAEPAPAPPAASSGAVAPTKAQLQEVELKATDNRQIALLAGGCFWGVEDLLRKLPGVLETTVGYTGGRVADPGYGDVKTGRSGHAESVQVVFDPSQISYSRILEYFFSIHDPTTTDRQGNDVGSQYRSTIFVVDDAQREAAEAVMAKVTAAGDWKAPLATKVEPAGKFYPAESYHQDYLEKNPGGYTCHYERDVSFY